MQTMLFAIMACNKYFLVMIGTFVAVEAGLIFLITFATIVIVICVVKYRKR